MQNRIWMCPVTNPTNKYNELLSISLEKKGCKIDNFSYKNIIKMKKGDIVHFHWINDFYQNNRFILMIFKTLKFLLILNILKARGIKIVWTVHNLYPHKYRWISLEKIIRRTVMLICNKLIVAAESIKQEVIIEFRVTPTKIEVIPHGNYNNVYPINNIDYRKKYKIDPNKIVFLFIGAIKEYKGIMNLLNSYKKLNSRNSVLIIAGKIYDGLETQINQFTKQNGIILDLRFIPDEELGNIILSSDYVVLPYKNITTSGSAILAVSLRRKIICPTTPFMSEYFDNSTAIMYDNDKKDGLLDALKFCTKNRQIKEIPEGNYSDFLKKLSWGVIADRIKKMYCAL